MGGHINESVSISSMPIVRASPEYDTGLHHYVNYKKSKAKDPPQTTLC